MKKLLGLVVLSALLLGTDISVFASSDENPLLRLEEENNTDAIDKEVSEINDDVYDLDEENEELPSSKDDADVKKEENIKSQEIASEEEESTNTEGETIEEENKRMTVQTEEPAQDEDSKTDVAQNNGIMSYSVAKSIQPPRAVENLKAQVINGTQVKLTWSMNGKADGFLVYRKKANEAKFTYRYLVKGNNFTDTTAEIEQYNFYRIYPFNLDTAGNRVVGSSTSYVYAKPSLVPKAVTGLKAALEYSNNIKLSWNSSANATGYIIYRKVEYESSFSYRYMVNGTSFLDTAAVQGQYNFYRVYPYYTDKSGIRHIGQSSSYVYALPLGMPATANLDAFNTPWNGSLSITWNLDYTAVNYTEIDGFLIYRRIGNTGDFKYRAILDKQNLWNYSFEDTTASYTDYNFYKIYPFRYSSNGKRQIGPCNSYTYGKAKIQAVYSYFSYEQINQVRLQWDKNEQSNVDGYDIYRKQGNNAFKYIGTTKQTEYIDKTASKTTMNFYRVYPYKIIDGKRVQGLSNSYQYGKAKNYSLGQAIADYGWQFIGTPYVWGGNDLRTGVDCSGFTSQVYAHFGITIPRTSYTQEDQGKDMGRNLSNAQPGDIICYCYDLSEEACHVAIYVGNGRMINSTTTHKADGSVIDGIQIGYADYMQIKTIRRYW